MRWVGARFAGFLALLLLAWTLTGCGSGAGNSLLTASPGSTTNATPHRFSRRDDTPVANNYSPRAQPASYGGDKNLIVVADLPPPAAGPAGTDQKIAPNDILEVKVFGVDKLDREVQVDGTGRISLPLIGEVVAAGKSERQLEREIRRRYGRSYLQNPQITVNVKESAGRRVAVEGEVNRAGLYPVTAQSSLLRVLAQARGFTQIGNPAKVYVFRKVGDKTYVANYNVEQIRTGARRDPRIVGGDVVVVFSSASKVAMENLKSVLGLATSAGRLAVLPY